MVTIRVGRPNVDTYIAASVGFLHGGGVRSAKSDSSGNAYIDFDDFGEEFKGKIVVNGDTIYEGYIHTNGSY